MTVANFMCIYKVPTMLLMELMSAIVLDSPGLRFSIGDSMRILKNNGPNIGVSPTQQT